MINYSSAKYIGAAKQAFKWLTYKKEEICTKKGIHCGRVDRHDTVAINDSMTAIWILRKFSNIPTNPSGSLEREHRAGGWGGRESWLKVGYRWLMPSTNATFVANTASIVSELTDVTSAKLMIPWQPFDFCSLISSLHPNSICRLQQQLLLTISCNIC